MFKKILMLAIMTLFIISSASAYIINFEAPATVESGSVFIITGTSTLPAGFSTEIEFYKKAQVGNNKVDKLPFTIQDGGVWSVEVDTKGWEAGQYTVSIPANSEYSYGSSSTLLRMFTVTKAASTETETVVATTESTQAPSEATAEVTSLPAEAPSSTSAPVSSWICLMGVFMAFVLIKTGVTGSKKE